MSGAFVPVEAEPAQASEISVERRGDEAGAVRVFDAQDECAAVAPREQAVEERRANVADVRDAGRARRIAGPDVHAASVSSADRPGSDPYA